MRLITQLFLIAILAGCSTMEFTNGPDMEDSVVRQQWHHLGIAGLIEFSRPVDIDYDCDNKQWNSFTIEQTAVNLLAGMSLPYFSLYSPWTVVYECREHID